jgi:Tol biopolymer transport system component
LSVRPDISPPRAGGPARLLLLALLVSGCGSEIEPGSQRTGESRGESTTSVRRLDPVGHPIVFASDRAGDFDLWAITATGDDPQRLTSAVGDEVLPVWSPDRSRLAFACGPLDEEGADDQPLSICMLSVNEQGVRKLSPDVHGAVTSWSPDGTQVLVAASDAGRDFPRLVVMGADGSGPRTLADEGEWGDWSPDGRHILYDAPNAARDGHRLWLMSADGSGKRPLGPDDADRYEATWSPDGRLIAYVTPTGKPGDEDAVAWNEDIGVMRADGSDAHPLVTTSGNDHWPPAWSPDSTRIVHAADGEDNEGELVIVDLRTRHSRQLSDNDDHDLTPAWR